MRTKSVAVTVAAQSLAALLNIAETRVNGIALQAPATNAASVFFGGSDAQVAELAVDSSYDNMPVKSTREVFVRGTVGDTLTVILF